MLQRSALTQAASYKGKRFGNYATITNKNEFVEVCKKVKLIEDITSMPFNPYNVATSIQQVEEDVYFEIMKSINTVHDGLNYLVRYGISSFINVENERKII